DGNGLVAAGRARDGIEHGGVVGTVAARLHEQHVLCAVGLEHGAEGFARPGLMRPWAVAWTVGIGEAGGVDDMGVAIDDVGGGHASLAMALVVTGSRRWMAFGSRATDAVSPRRRLVSRPTRATISWRESPMVSISRVSAPSGSTA